MNLVEKQRELQKDAIVKLQEKLKEQKIDKHRVFKKRYLDPLKKAFIDLRKKALPNAVAHILKKNREFLENIALYIDDFKEWNDYPRLKKAVEEQNEIKEYLIEDMAKFLSLALLKLVEERKIALNKETIFYKLYEFLTDQIIDIDTTIQKYDLQQKPSLSLFTLQLTSTEVIYTSFATLSNLEFVKKKDDDKINPASEQQLIKNISEELYAKVNNTASYTLFKKIEEPENKHLIEMSSEIFILFEAYNIIEKIDIDGKFDTYTLSADFMKNSKSFLEIISQYAPVFFEPMVIPPREWTTIDDGGYLHDDDLSLKYKLTIQKARTKEEKRFIRKQSKNISKDFLKAINILQATKYKIDQKVFKATQRYIENELKKTYTLLKERKKETKSQKKELDQKIEKLYEKLNSIRDIYVGKVEMLKEFIQDKEELEERKEELKKARQKDQKELKKELKKLKKEKSLLTKEMQKKLQKLKTQQKILSVAEKYKEYDEIYFTYQADFRGRLYPVQALLNPQGESLSKALLTFSEKKELGKNGAFWLKVHGANCYGIDKVSFKERIEWVDTNEENIQRVAAAKDPFDDPFLQKADDVYKFLAFCYEFDEYLKDKENFKSSLPIAIDGSNNGFQHIAALLRDTQGAKKVNVLPTDEDIPADIYKEVAQKLKEILPDSTDGIIDDDISYIKEHIDRSFVKKGVMTDSYGAGTNTKAEQLQDFMEDNDLSIHIKSDLEKFSKFLAKYLEEAIDKVAPSSAKYKKWISYIAGIVSALKQPIVWHTPFINFLVRQVEYKYKEERIVTSFKGRKNSIQIRVYSDEIDPKEQKKGIAPNFIHSLDSTHMYMTLLSCFDKKIDAFAVVHDSFATHACDIETMQQVLKEEFIKLTKYDVLTHFQEEIANRYGFDIVEKLSKKKVEKSHQIQDIKTLFVDKDFDIEKIKESRYFFA
ncbi:Phage RNA polymerase [hydrothermal vent metagenome]|uniref:DNA-directed RNA polymerase n=1 Tax=hydrothermal vent metagenome TaxID=652676 RepID=A0A1W1BEV9_9ZZZZ